MDNNTKTYVKQFYKTPMGVFSFSLLWYNRAQEVSYMYTLFIDTHDKNVLIILYKDGKIIKKENIASANKHSEITMPVLDKVLVSADVSVNDLNNVIVVNGPGSFTGERIAVTIGKTIAYCLNLPIRVIDSLTILSLNVNRDKKIVALEDRNGAYVGVFDKNNNKMEDFKYLSKSVYDEYKQNNDVLTSVDVDYDLVYDYVMNLNTLNPHEVKPLYVKGISALNGK